MSYFAVNWIFRTLLPSYTPGFESGALVEAQPKLFRILRLGSLLGLEGGRLHPI